MIWRNPWAWLGFAALALPVLIHLLGRGHARVQPFPSLRFLERSKLLPTRRTRLHDIGLLAMRVAIFAAAVAALAQPFVRNARRGRTSTTALARAILVDTSSSMRRASAGGSTALDAARRDARRLAAESQTSVVIESSHPARELQGADAWLNRQAGRRELVILSDFQSGVLAAGDLAVMRPGTGIRLARAPSSASAAASEVVARSTSGAFIATTTAKPTSTDVQWSLRPNDAARGEVALLAAPTDRTVIDAVSRAAASVGVRLPLDTTHAVSIVFPSYEHRVELARRITRLDEPWMTDLVAQLRADSLLIDATRDATAVASFDSVGLVVARGASGRPVVAAATGEIDGRSQLILFAATEPRSLASAALIAAVDRARSIAAPLAELEPTTIPDQTLAAWQRESASDATPQSSSESTDSDGRWLWILALALLALETWMRRTLPPKITSAETVHDRAA